MANIEFIEEELRDADYREFVDHSTPCDYPDENGEHHCPFDNISESERCRVCCGLGVDE